MAKKKYYNSICAEDYVLNKDLAIESFIKYNLDRTQSMFKYTNLPNSLPETMVELQLQKNGNCFVTMVDDELYALTGGEGGEPDVYGRPTIYTVANPALNISKNYKIGVDGVLIKNDTYEWGLLPLFNKYGSLLVENEITIRTIIIYLRMVGLISASDDKTKASADQFIADITAGKLAVVADSPFFDGVKLQSLGNSSSQYIQQFIEIEQYLKGSMYNELGLNANYNMKRETLTKSETALNEDFLMPFCDDMLDSRKRGWDEVNEMFGTAIAVEYSSTWKKRSVTDILAIEQAQAETESSQLEDETENSDITDEVENITDETVTDNVTDENDDAQTEDTSELSDLTESEIDEMTDDTESEPETETETDTENQDDNEAETETETETDNTDEESSQLEDEDEDEKKERGC